MIYRPRAGSDGNKVYRNDRISLINPTSKAITQYQLGDCLGKGQFGSVYKALNMQTGQITAVKRIDLDGRSKVEAESLMGEVDLLKSLSHVRIVNYLGYVQSESCLDIILEFVENGSLQQLLRSYGTFSPTLVCSYTSQILEGLIYLHAKDVVHCDLKAANILTTKDGKVKLTDFGVSLNLNIKSSDNGEIVAGTPNWMAPEVISLQGASTASDIWSLGCTIIELLTGKPPYSELNAMAALYRIVEDHHPPLPDDLSENLHNFLILCFQKEPVTRPTAEELFFHDWIIESQLAMVNMIYY
ncbi:kinase-like protein [Neoconidiobolus thromboides FSU 785]|nr:kinase-like protein [Neoconidiobolus thromboides FSU 785]